MANLKLKKADLKGPLQVGHGWLVANAWAVRAGDDTRLVNVDTLNAGFRGLDVSAVAKAQASYLNANAKVPIFKDGWHRTNLLVEGEDGVLCRVYRDVVNTGFKTRCFNEDYCRILGNPEQLVEAGAVFSCGSGIIAPTTDEAPPWAEALV